MKEVLLSFELVGSAVAVHGLGWAMACRLSVSGPMSPALEGRFLITGPPGKSHSPYFIDEEADAHKGEASCPL